MARLAGVDFYRGEWDAGTTSGGGLSDMADRGVAFGIAKVGQADFLDSRWDEHKAKLNALVQPFQKGAYWFLERAHPSGDVPGYFYPPIARGQDYIPSSYGKGWTDPSHGHNNFAVDFNRVGGGDEGQAVRAIADGVVAASNLAWDDAPPHFYTDGSWQATYGTRFIDHVGGYRSQYTHMKNITVSAGDAIVRGQKIGEVSSVGGSPSGAAYAHLHHVHMKRSAPGQPYVPLRMRFFGDVVGASRADTWTRTFTPNRWTSATVTGVRLPAGTPPPAYTGASQADAFLEAISASHDPSGWLCALDVEAPPNAEYGITAGWPQVRQFADEFWRQAPGYPLFLYTRKGFWIANIKDGDRPANAKVYGFAGTWTADYTQIGAVQASQFATATAGLSFAATSATPYAGGYAGFAESEIIQYGPLRVAANGATRSLDGNAYKGNLARLRVLATTVVGSGPGPGNVLVPYLVGDEEDAALDELTTAGLIAGTRTTANDPAIAVDRVISTSPAAGATVATGSAVDYVVSLGPSAPAGGLDPTPMSPCGE